MRPVCAALLLFLALAPLLSAADEFSGPYPARVLRVTDGDTVHVAVDIWPGFTWTGAVRLTGVDTPELRGSPPCERALAEAAAAFTRRFLSEARTIKVSGIGLGKYAGRVLGSIQADGRDLAAALLAAGHARPYDGGSRAAKWCG